MGSLLASRDDSSNDVGKRTREPGVAAPKELTRIVGDKWYGPAALAEILGVSYNTALRTMGRMRRTANFAAPRAKKRLLRVKGSDLRDYLKGKIG